MLLELTNLFVQFADCKFELFHLLVLPLRLNRFGGLLQDLGVLAPDLVVLLDELEGHALLAAELLALVAELGPGGRALGWWHSVGEWGCSKEL